MARTKTKRKIPITAVVGDGQKAAPNSASKSKSVGSSHTRGVIRRFHVLLKRKEQLQKTRRLSTNTEPESTELKDIEDELNALGGLKTYQAMSAIGQSAQRGGGSEKVLISWLKELNLHKTVLESSQKLKSVRLTRFYDPSLNPRIHE